MVVKVEAYLDLEASLQALVLPQWNKIQRRVVPQIEAAILDHDLAKVTEIVDTINTSLLYQGKLKSINTLLTTGMVFGGALINGTTLDLEIVLNPDALEMPSIATNQYQIQLDQAMITVRKRFLQLAVKLHLRAHSQDFPPCKNLLSYLLKKYIHILPLPRLALFPLY